MTRPAKRAKVEATPVAELVRRSIARRVHQQRPVHFAGLDLSLTGTGLVVVDDTGAVVHHATYAAPKNLYASMPARHDALRHSILAACTAHDPAVLAVEGYAFGAKNNREQAGELGGLVRWALWREQWPYFDVAPTALKRFVTGKGNAPKDVILKEVFKRWAFDTSDNNQADAYGLARLALHVWSNALVSLAAPDCPVIFEPNGHGALE